MDGAAASQRIALRLLQFGAFAVVLAATPFKLFDLDRFFIPKELVLNAIVAVVALICVARVRRLVLSRVDQLLVLWLVLGALSALFATNWWLAGRAVAISFTGAACYWCARALSRAGLSRSLVAALAAAGIIGAATALLQAYGVHLDLFSLNRAPGGTFGNRNFMAHLCAIALPALLFSTLRASSRQAVLRWAAGTSIVAAALILSRSRAAWLALFAGLAVFLLATLFAMRKRDGAFKLRRLLLVVIAAAAGSGAALVIPNALDWKSDSPYLETAHSLVNYRAGSGKGRLVQYGNSLRMSLHHPLLGVGPGNWPVVYPRFASEDDPSLGPDGMTSNPWPSSDWVTFISERGAAAFVVLMLALLALITDALRAVRDGETEDARLSAAVLLATVAALIVVGSFDAVLLLPIPALVGWALLGALTAGARERASFDVAWPTRLLACVVIAAFGALAVARNGAQVAAMSFYSNGTTSKALERASSLDPGSYRIHIRLAEAYKSRGDCGHSRIHAGAARALFPSAPAARRLLASCGG